VSYLGQAPGALGLARDGGETAMLPGQVVEAAYFREQNEKVGPAQPAQPPAAEVEVSLQMRETPEQLL